MALSTQKISIRLFEDASVSWNNQDAIDWPNLTVRRLASFLALNQGVSFSRREVSDALWGEGRYRSNSLSVALYQMRHALEEAGISASQVIRADRNTMEVNHPGIEVDWLRFLDEVGQAEAEDSAEAALEALSGVTGPLLHEINDGWALQAKEHYEEKIKWCLECISRSLPLAQLASGTEEMARVVALCMHSSDCGDRLVEALAARDVSAARRFGAAVHRLGIQLSQPIAASGSAGGSHHLGVLLLVEGADLGPIDSSLKGLDPGMDLPANSAAFLDPSCALETAHRLTGANPKCKVLISVELFGSANEVPPGARSVMKQMRGPGIHIDGTTPLKRSRLVQGRHQSKSQR